MKITKFFQIYIINGILHYLHDVNNKKSLFLKVFIKI